jgi:hypothetical protein
VAGDDPVHGLVPDLGPQLGEHGFEVAFRALLAFELQVALEFAPQVAFQYVACDLRGHDPASGDDLGPFLLPLTSGGKRENGQGTVFDCEAQEHLAYESAHSCVLPSLASYSILRFAFGQAP